MISQTPDALGPSADQKLRSRLLDMTIHLLLTSQHIWLAPMKRHSPEGQELRGIISVTAVHDNGMRCTWVEMERHVRCLAIERCQLEPGSHRAVTTLRGMYLYPQEHVVSAGS
jgi:hypothetical protein